MSIASSGALVISLSGDDIFTEVSLNDVIGIAERDSFVFRQVSSVDGKNFFWKDFSPTLNDKPAEFFRIDAGDTHKRDYIDANREIHPLTKADDAILLDNSDMTLKDQLVWIKEILKQREK
jgi:hypothetical protein